ncbi:hypothetical protein Tco_1177330, partial [Tanacetum coccineum]
TNFGRDKNDSKEICKCSYNGKWNVKFKEHMQQRELEANAREQARERE